MQRLTAPFDYLKLSTKQKRFVSEDFVNFRELQEPQRDSRVHASCRPKEPDADKRYLRTPENA